ncbi:MAG: hypothetical protein OJI67_07510 [Prosthecobacter sp.]|nr:hypothetical protein [Prosthecobacter sp.]
MRHKTQHPILLCLALLALGWAQVFGLMRGYVCDCDGVVEITAFDHCHGPHGVACHHDAEPTHHHDGTTGDTSDHTPLKEAVNAKQLSLQGSSAPLPILMVISILQPLTLLQAEYDLTNRHAPAFLTESPGRRWPQRLAHTIALRV